MGNKKQTPEWAYVIVAVIGAIILTLVMWMIATLKTGEERFLEEYKAELPKSFIVKHGEDLDREALRIGYAMCEVIEEGNEDILHVAVFLQKGVNPEMRHDVIYDKAVEHLCGNMN